MSEKLAAAFWDVNGIPCLNLSPQGIASGPWAKGGGLDDLLVNALQRSGNGQALAVTGLAAGSFMSFDMVFTETAGAGTYTAAVAVPTGAWMFNIWAYKSAEWLSDAADLTIGDGVFANRWANAASILDDGGLFTSSYTVVDLGASLFIGGFNQGGGHVVDTLGNPVPPYATPDTITATLVTTGAGGTTGRLLLRVILLLQGSSTNAAKH